MFDSYPTIVGIICKVLDHARIQFSDESSEMIILQITTTPRKPGDIESVEEEHWDNSKYVTECGYKLLENNPLIE